MNRLVIGTLSLSMLTIMSVANKDFYIGVGTAMEMVDGYDGSDDMGTAIEVKVGKVFDNNFVIEGQVTKTISSAKIDVDAGGGEYYPNVEMDFMTYSIWGKYNFPLSSDLTLSPKIGFVKIDVTGKQDSDTIPTEDDSRMALGIEIKKSLPAQGFDIYAGYNIFASDFSYLSFGIQKSF